VPRSNIVNVDEMPGLADVFDICGGGGGGGHGPAHCAKLAVVAPSIVAATTAMRRNTPVIRLQDPAYIAAAVVTPEAPSLNTVKAPSSPVVETAAEASRPSLAITAPNSGFLRCSKLVSKPTWMRARLTFGLAVVNAQHARLRAPGLASAVFLVFVA
jgi:hypothetical protein